MPTTHSVPFPERDPEDLLTLSEVAEILRVPVNTLRWRWRARYRDEADREHARHFARKIDAQRWLDAVTASIVRGDYVDPRAGRETVRAYAIRWQAVQVSSDGTARIVDNALRLHVVPALGGRPIGSVRRSDIQAFVKVLEAKGLSAGTVRNIYEVAARVFEAAVEDRIISASPCRRITLPRSDGQRSFRPRSRRSRPFAHRLTLAGAPLSSPWPDRDSGSASCWGCRSLTSTSCARRSASSVNGCKAASWQR